ncbi:MAG TPA: glycosyltransferase family 39 protein [Bryobacterales bacterium]|nr:glycosyltransferase family 39 protein [Bryobacterales bacterium]
MDRSGSGAEAFLIVIAAWLGYTSLCFGIIPQIDIDTGRDFLVPQLLLQGRTLYHGVMYQFGPFAPWFHWLLFRVFSPSTTVILIAGAVAGCAIVCLTFLLAREILPAGAAATAALVVLAHAVYAPHNMGYAMPYTFSATYGLLFSLLALCAAARSLERGCSPWDFLMGAATGLALASKQDFAVISLCVMLCSWAFRWPALRRRLLAAMLANLASCGAFAGLFALLLLRRVSVAELLPVAYPRQYLAALKYYYDVVQGWGPSGWSKTWEALAGFALNFGFILSAACLAALLAGLARGERPSRKFVLVLAVVASPFLVVHRYLGYFPVLLHASVLGFVIAGKIRENRRKVAFLAVSAVVFFFRVLPSPKLAGYPYPYLYYIPSLILYVYLCYSLAAPGLARFFPAERLQAAMIAVFAVCFVAYPLARWTWPWTQRAVQMATPRGAFRTEPAEAAKTRAVLDGIQRYSAPRDPILLIPFGTMYYFLSDRQPASKYIDYGYGMLIDGEEEAREIGALSRQPPKLVIMEDVPQSLYFPGPVNSFGAAYNVHLSRWIRQNYREVRAVRLEGRLIHFLIPAGGASTG